MQNACSGPNAVKFASINGEDSSQEVNLSPPRPSQPHERHPCGYDDQALAREEEEEEVPSSAPTFGHALRIEWDEAWASETSVLSSKMKLKQDSPPSTLP